jgi:hypothetical protein
MTRSNLGQLEQRGLKFSPPDDAIKGVQRALTESLAGPHSFSDEIAGEFVSQESSWNKLARRAPAGWDMNPQIVLETNIIGTTSSSPKIVDAYFWK